MTLFMHSAELDAAWEFVMPILEAWQAETPPRLAMYPAGSWGPAEADRLTTGCLCGWREP
jgi:glucose-6-phosphate 1-dehydrogenase